jgi:Plastocyanin
VTWWNSTNANHTITSDSGNELGHPIGRDEVWSHPFDVAGTYAYHCTIHPSMHGTITVQ